MDVGLVYGVLASAAAITAGFAGTKAASLTREAGTSGLDLTRSDDPKASREIAQIDGRVRAAISERSAGAQSAAAWLATSTALLGVASTRPAADAIGIGFVVIGVALIVVAIQEVWNANAVADLQPARLAFEHWYVTWLHHATSTAGKPTDEQIAKAFASQNPRHSRTMRRFHVWPFHSPPIAHMVPPSEWIREKYR